MRPSVRRSRDGSVDSQLARHVDGVARRCDYPRVSDLAADASGAPAVTGRRPPTALVLALVAAATLAGCGESGPVRMPVDIADARLTAPDILELGVGTCNGDPEITEITQDDDQVRVKITSTVTNPGDACGDIAVLLLDAPLGDRELISLGRRRPVVVEVSGRS